jgi:hypothetical protein
VQQSLYVSFAVVLRLPVGDIPDMAIITTGIVEYCNEKFTLKIVVYIEEYSPDRTSRFGQKDNDCIVLQ